MPKPETLTSRIGNTCFICGSAKLYYIKTKLYCEKCGTLLENCCGD